MGLELEPSGAGRLGESAQGCHMQLLPLCTTQLQETQFIRDLNVFNS